MIQQIKTTEICVFRFLLCDRERKKARGKKSETEGREKNDAPEFFQ